MKMTDTTDQTATPMTREQLRAWLDRVEAAKRAVEENMAPLRAQLEPYERQLSDLDGMMDEMLEPHGDYLGRCEACGVPLLVGDEGFRYEDGPIFCAEHAPTYGGVLADLKTYTTEDWDEEDHGPLAAAIAKWEALVAECGAETPCTRKL